jgi:hypothetical protein
MNLLDLGDDELIPIFQRVDHKTKLNLMLTCKRFENVIGNYLELFGKFVLTTGKSSNKPDRVQKLTQMRRHFERIHLYGYDLRLDTEDYNMFVQLLTKVGSKLVELIVSSGQICFDSLANLLRLTPNISKLELGRVEITPRADFNVQIKLEKLRRFELRGSSSIEILEKILKPNSLYEIKILCPIVSQQLYHEFPADYWTVIPRILSKQEKLVSLELDNCTIMNFPDSPEIWAFKDLLKLSLGFLKFETPKDFENFTKFIKSLDKLTDLTLKHLDYEESLDERIRRSLTSDDKIPNDYTELLTHLLFLPTLSKLTFKYFDWYQNVKILNLKLQNPNVEDLTIEEITDGDTERYSKYMKVLPNVRKASVCFNGDDEYTADMGHDNLYDYALLLKSWTLLEELEVQDRLEEMLYLIDLKSLRGFKTGSDWEMEPEPWEYFCLNHPQLERFEIRANFFQNLPVIVENLPNLKTLICKRIEPRHISEEEAIKMIAEKCAKLEYLEIHVKKMKAETAVTVLKEKLPGLRGFVKELNDHYKILNTIKL